MMSWAEHQHGGEKWKKNIVSWYNTCINRHKSEWVNMWLDDVCHTCLVGWYPSCICCFTYISLEICWNTVTKGLLLEPHVCRQKRTRTWPCMNLLTEWWCTSNKGLPTNIILQSDAKNFTLFLSTANICTARRLWIALVWFQISDGYVDT